MLYELVLLPGRCYDGYALSTEVPLFSSIDSSWPDACTIVGDVIDQDSIGLFKYKAVETFGSNVIERIILSHEPIETHVRGWWEANINVAVIQTKYFTSLGVHLVRNIKSIRSVMQISNLGRGNIYSKLAKSYNLEKLSKLSSTFIPNSDTSIVGFIEPSCYGYNVDKESKKCIHNLYRDVEHIPQLSIEHIRDEIVDLKKLTRFINKPTATDTATQEQVDRIVPRFDMEEEEYYSSVDYSWTLLELLHQLNGSGYTSIYLNCNTHLFKTKSKGESYRGVKDDLRKVSVLFELWLREMMKSKSTPIKQAILDKTYSEEVFIELTCDDDSKIRYYFDLVLFILGTIINH